MGVISSTKNRQVVKAARLKKRAMRDKERRFLVEGSQVTAEALEAGKIEELFHVPGSGGRVDPVVERAGAAGVRLTAVSEKVMAHLTGTVTPQGVVGVAAFVDVPAKELPDDAKLVPILCAVRDPGNAGTILRSADAAGADGIVFTEESVDVYNPKTVRASAGSLFHLPVVRDSSAGQAVELVRARGGQVLAAAADGESSVYEADFSRPTAVLLGNEAWGLDPEVRSLADRTVRIPIRGKAESLNLAAAAALVMFESARQREVGGAKAGASPSLVSAAAHDLRSPLTGLTGFASTMLSSWDRFEDEGRREMVQAMLLEGHRVSALTKLVIDAARLEEGRLAMSQETTEVAEAASWVSQTYGGVSGLPSVEVQGSGEVSADPDRLRSVLLLLCEALVWWTTEGPIAVRIGKADGGVEVVIERGGDGPEREQLKEILAGPASGGKVGTYAARLITEAMGGTITCEGGKGLTFTLDLPRG